MKHLERRLVERKLKLLQMQTIEGAHAGNIYRIEVMDEDHRRSRYVYKEFAADRSNEVEIYSKAKEYIQPFSKYVDVWDTPPQAILMRDLQSPLKKEFKGLSDRNKRKQIVSILERLAVLHSSTIRLVANELPTHRVTSEWRDWCLDQLTRLRSRSQWMNPDWINVIKDSYDQLDETHYNPSSPLVLTHGDPHLENIFILDEQVWFIDWEWTTVASPLRDITILVQDLYDSKWIQFVKATYHECLKNKQFHISDEDYRRDFHYLYIDHTTMMLAWEIEKYFQGYTMEEEIQRMIDFKIGEINRVREEELGL
ncbi:phosphotransferase family protein [Rossellomorea arthrocnemi]